MAFSVKTEDDGGLGLPDQPAWQAWLPETGRASLEARVDAHPDTGELVVCLEARLADVEGTHFVMWLRPGEACAVVAQIEAALRELGDRGN